MNTLIIKFQDKNGVTYTQFFQSMEKSSDGNRFYVNGVHVDIGTYNAIDKFLSERNYLVAFKV